MFFFITIIINDLAKILGAWSIVNIGHINIGDKIRTKAFLNLVLTVFFFLFFSNLSC